MTENQIEWRPVVGFEDSYECSSDGKVRSIERLRNSPHGGTRIYPSRVLRGKVDRCGYVRVGLNTGGGKKHRRLAHRLIAEAFIPKVEGKRFVNHKNGKKRDNRAVNLEWVTSKENVKHSIETGLTTNIGETSHLAKMTAENVKQIVEMANQGLTYREISQKFGVRLTTVGEIMRGKSWSMVTGIKSPRRSQLTPEQALRIVDLIKEGSSRAVVAETFGVSRATVSSIINGLNWSETTGIKKSQNL